MENRLPTFEIEGTPFIVDVDYGLLRHPADNQNFIEFRDMVDKGTHYRIRYDAKSQMADPYGEGGEGLKKVKIPPMVKLDPERVAKKYNMKVSELPDRDSELRTDPTWFKQRKSGRLPNIRICGHNYFIKADLGILEPENLMADVINLHGLHKDPTNTYFSFMFNPASQTVIHFDKGIKTIPDGVLMVKIPHERVLDPFIRLRDMGFENHPERLGAFPVRFDMEARVMGWDETGIPKPIKKNNVHKAANQRTGKRPGKGI